MTTRHRIVVGLALCGLILSAPAYAQRGSSFVEQSEPRRTPLTGFPGLFDSNTVAKGDVVVDLPLLSVNMGVTENLSVGTIVMALIPLAAGQPAAFATMRYRFYSTPEVVSVIDAMVGYFSYEDVDSLGGLVVSNTTLALGDVQSVTLTGMAGRIAVYEDLDDPPGAEASSDVLGLGIAATYQVHPLRWLALRFTAMNVPVVAGSNETSFGASSARLGSSPSDLWDRTVVRGYASVRLGNWLLGGGSYLHTGGTPLPWASVAKKW